MKRYNLVFRDDYGKLTSYGYLDEVESSEGEWVRYEDVVKLKDELKFYKRQLSKLEEQITAMKRTIIVTSEYWKN